jgi:hypothetical protein
MAEADEELLTFDISDDALERAAPIIGGVASVVTLNFATAIIQLRLPRLNALILRESALWRVV